MYESRIYIINRNEYEHNGRKFIYADEIAVFNMCGMRQGFTDIFTEEKDFNIYADDGNTVIDEDKYGERLRMTDIKNLVEWLRKEIKKDDYRRLKPLYAFLLKLAAEDWGIDGRLVAVHYGY